MNTTTIPVSDLSGAALDWAVAKCEGHLEGGFFAPCKLENGKLKHYAGEPDPYHDELPDYSPSSDWSLAGPIIEREDIVILRDCDGYGVDSDGFTTNECFKIWRAVRERGGQQPTRFAEYERDVLYYDAHEGRTGPTPLVAAMRCYVAFKLGDTVDVPSELL